MATFLDPRYRLLLDSIQTESAKRGILKEFQNTGASVAMDTEEEETTESEPPPPSKKYRYLSSILHEKKKEQASSRPTTPSDKPELDELTLYASSKLDISEDVDPLQFWTDGENAYPLLASLAYDLLCIPASSAPVERVFSTAGLISSGRRNRISDKNFGARDHVKKKQGLPLSFTQTVTKIL